MNRVHFEWMADYIAEQYPPKQCNCRDEVLAMVLEAGEEFNKNFSENRFFDYLHARDKEMAGTDGSQP